MSSDPSLHVSAPFPGRETAPKPSILRKGARLAGLLLIALGPIVPSFAQPVPSASAEPALPHMDASLGAGFHPGNASETAAAVVHRIEDQIAQNGPSASLYSQLGVARYRNHEPDKSLNAFTSMLKFRQPDADELRIIALDYVDLRDLQSADKWLRASLKLNPTDWRTWRYLGGVQFSEELIADALISFRECLRLDPQNALAEDGLARSLEAQGNLSEARRHFESAEQMNRADASPSALPPLHYGEFLFRQNNLSQALAELTFASRLAPGDAETHEYLSHVHRESGELKEAVEEMRTASQLRPDSPRLHLLLGRLYRSAGSPTEANTEINRYVELSSQHKQDWDR